jgi:hypothetical protein
MSQPAVARLESGEHNPSFPALLCICGALRIELVIARCAGRIGDVMHTPAGAVRLLCRESGDIGSLAARRGLRQRRGPRESHFPKLGGRFIGLTVTCSVSGTRRPRWATGCRGVRGPVRGESRTRPEHADATGGNVTRTVRFQDFGPQRPLRP